MKGMLEAFKFLSFVSQFDRARVDSQQLKTSIPYFPLVGIFLGLALVLINRLLDPRLESEILGVLLVAVLALLTGAIHYQGLQNTFDALSVKMSTLEPIGRNHAFGALAIVFVVLFKIRALEVTGEARNLGLLLTPLFARWASVIFLYGSSSAAEGTARILADNVRAWHVVLTTVVTLVLAAWLVGRMALWIGLYLSLFALLSRSYVQRRNGCIDSDNFGAIIELSEMLSFVLFASL